MAAEPNAVEQAVSRTLRDNLGRIQRSAEELHQAVNDLVSACASSRPSNALPPMVRAQTSAAALSATLEVLSRFVTSALQPPVRLPFEPEFLRAPATVDAPPPVAHIASPVVEPVVETAVEHNVDVAAQPEIDSVVEPAVGHVAESIDEQLSDAVQEQVEEPVSGDVTDPVADHFAHPVVDRVVDDGLDHAVADVVTYAEHLEPAPTHPIEEGNWTVPTAVEQPSTAADVQLSAETSQVSDIQPPFEMPPAADLTGNFPSAIEPVFLSEPVPVFVHEVAPAVEQVEQLPVPEAQAESTPVEAADIFSIDSLPVQEQELHRRAFRIAKVSMQDIKMLRPEDVRLGRENNDLCFRLRDDIEKAHKEYDRRFHSIQSHPVDYFYDWMVEILAGGNSQALGEYPYPSPVLRR